MPINNQYDGAVVDGANNFQKEGDIRVRLVKSSRPVKSPRASIPPKHSLRGRPKSLTDKLNAYREAVYRDTYREVNRQIYREVCREVY